MKKKQIKTKSKHDSSLCNATKFFQVWKCTFSSALLQHLMKSVTSTMQIKRKASQELYFRNKFWFYSGCLSNLVLTYWFSEKSLCGNITSNNSRSCPLNLLLSFWSFFGNNFFGESFPSRSTFLPLFMGFVVFFLLTRTILGLASAFDFFGFLCASWVLLLGGK